MVGGELTLAGNTINTTTPQKPLEIQSHAQSPVQFMGGLVEFFTDGGIKTEGSIEAEALKAKYIQITDGDEQKILGSGIIPAGEVNAFIEVPDITQSSFVSITATTSLAEDTMYLESIADEKGFTIQIDKAKEKDITFNWWVLLVD
jgi:hypothetical protein